MLYVLALLILLSFVYLCTQYMKYLRVRSANPGYGAQKAAGYLFLALIAVIGISNIFAEAIFELLGLDKPENFEWLALAAYAVMATAMAIIFRPQQPDKVDFGTGNIVNYKNEIKNQTNKL